jgi:hypothetical protein
MSASWFEPGSRSSTPKKFKGGYTVTELSEAYHCPPCTIFYKLYDQFPKEKVWSTMCSNDLDPTGVRAGGHDAHFVDGRVIHHKRCSLAQRSKLSLIETFDLYNEPRAQAERARIIAGSQAAWSARQQQAEASRQQQQQQQQQQQGSSAGGTQRDKDRAMWR